MDLFRLFDIESLQRTLSVDVLVATVPDVKPTKPQPEFAKEHFSLVKVRIEEQLEVREASDARLPPPVPAPKTLQDLVQAARRRLADDRRREEKTGLLSRARIADTLIEKIR